MKVKVSIFEERRKKRKKPKKRKKHSSRRVGVSLSVQLNREEVACAAKTIKDLLTD